MKELLSFTGQIVSCFAICLFHFHLSYAQPSYNIDDTDYVTDSVGIFYDNGGPSGNYIPTGDIQTFTICPENAGCIAMDFSLFMTESASNNSTGDVLVIYDGPDNTYPVIGTFSGALVDSDNAFGQVFAGGNGCMTIEFTENGALGVAGWEATWVALSSGCPTYSTLNPPVDCESAILICQEEPLNYNSNGPGVEELISQDIQGCIFTGETQSAWFIINISESAPSDIPLEFIIQPKPGGVDYDFAIYGPIEDCSELGDPIRCSYAEESAAGTLLTGLNSTEIDVSETPLFNELGTPANGFVKSILTKPGETYYLMVNNYSTNNVGFDLTWGQAVLDNGILDCSTCDLALLMTERLTFCQGAPIEIPVQTFQGSGSFDYLWDSNGAVVDYSGGSVLTVNPDVNFSGELTFTVTVTDELVNNCTEEASITIEIQSNFELDELDIEPTLCPEDTTDVALVGSFNSNAVYSWNLGTANYIDGDLNSAGPIQLSWLEGGIYNVTVNVQQGDCPPAPFVFETNVFEQLETPAVFCPELASDSTFTWNEIAGAVNYVVTWTINGVEVGTTDVNNTEITIEGAAGQEVQVFVMPSPMLDFCEGLEGASDICLISACETPNGFGAVGLEEFYCLEDAAVPLEGNPAGGVFTIGAAEITLFSPNTQGAGIYEINYTFTDTSGCVFSKIDSVTVLGTINGDFALPDSVCVGELISLVYEGETGVNTTFNWNLIEATPPTAMGTDTIETVWENAGMFDVELSISSNGCLLGEVTHPITVIQAPIAPVLECDGDEEGEGSVSWTSEANHLYYYAAFLNGVPIEGGFLENTTGNYTYPDSLSNGDTLEVQVFAAIEGQDFCGVSDTTILACAISSCVATPLSLTGLEESYCLADSSSLIEIVFEPAGGELSVSGTDSLIATNFQVGEMGMGEHSFTYTWTDADGCPNDTTFSTEVFENPVANFSLSSDSICESESITVTYSGAEGMENFDWNFGADIATATPLGEESYELTWNGTNTQTISLEVSTNGCLSAPITANIAIGATTLPPIISCQDSLDCILFEWDSSANDSLYVFELLTTPPDSPPIFGAAVTQSTTQYTICGLAPETEIAMSSFQVIGVSVCGNITSSNLPACMTVACNEVVEIGVLPNAICADADVFTFNFTASDGATIVGNGVTQTGVSSASFNPSIAGVGIHEVILTYTNTDTGCPTYADTTEIEVIEVPTANFDIGGGTEFCIGDEVDFSYVSNGVNVDSYLWNFGAGANPPISILPNPPPVSYNSAGEKTITLRIENGNCVDETTQNIVIVAPLETPVVNCNETSTTAVTFEWANIAGNVGYSISYSIDNLPPITDLLGTDSNTYTVNDLSPNQTVEITVIALGDAPCGDSEATTQSCIAQNCPVVNLEILGLEDEYCDTDCENSIPLTANPTGGVFVLGTDTITEFNPCQNAGTYTFFYHYTDNLGVCTYQTSQEVTVHTTPTITIDINGTEVCIEDSLDFSFGGSASVNAFYNWSFGANASPATSNTEGPHAVYWTSGGVKTIALEVEENGCSASDTIEIEVFDGLAAPIVNCSGSTQNSVGFSWSDVGGTGEFIYELYVNGTLEESNQSTFDLTYTLGDLQPQDSVLLVLYAIGDNVCGNSEAVERLCIAQDCPTLEPIIDGLETAYCQTIGSINLAASNIGGNGSGTGVFTLNGDTITAFDTNQAAGIYTIEYTYTEGACSGFDSQEVEIFAIPEVAIALSTEACEGEIVEVRFDGTAPIGSDFDWDFGADVLSSVEIAEQVWEVVWESEGVKEIGLEVDYNGCQDSASTELTIFAPLETPDLSCAEVTTNQIIFEWSKVSVSYHVQVRVNSLPVFEDFAYGDERYIVSNLNEEDEASIEVVPIGAAPCGNGGMVATTCRAADCPVQNVQILMETTSFCQDDLTVELLANVEGGVFTIDDDPTPVNGFDPVAASVGMHRIYYHYMNPDTNCPYVDSLEVNVFGLPEADFDLAIQACPDEAVVLEFTGNAPNTLEAGFDWGDFGGADEVTDLGDGQYELSWNGAGAYLVGLEITSEEGCVDAFDQMIEVTNLEVDVPTDFTIDQGEFVDIEVSANSSTSNIAAYLWGNTADLDCEDCPNPRATPSLSTLYTLQVVDEDGCQEEKNISVEVILPEPLPKIVLPNAFSPNGDGMNDVFRPIFNDLVVGIEFQIYNRWGERVFESRERDATWRGLYNRQLVDAGVYVYWLRVEFSDGTERLLSGNVTVVY